MIKMMNIVFDELVFLCYNSENTLATAMDLKRTLETAIPTTTVGSS